MPTTIEATPELSRIIADIHDKYETALDAPISASLLEAYAPVFEAVQPLKELLPDVNANAMKFAYDDMADENDYRAIYEGLSLVIMYVLIDIEQMEKATRLLGFFHMISTFADDLSDTCSYLPEYDLDHGIFVFPEAA